ncbi:MAG: LytTR family transcriptional regulator [archaeon]|nr:LytTR family transcriptional regulator [archaeon]
MNVDLFVSKNVKESRAEIHTSKLTNNIKKAVDLLENDSFDENSVLAVKNGKDIIILDFEDVYMFRVEDKQVKVFTENKEYVIKKPLYQIEEGLDYYFVRISKSTIVNLRKVDRVAPSLKGMMFISLENGLKDNISRKYLPSFKKALDI